jgi:hypothetical protein
VTARVINVLIGTWLLFATWVLPGPASGPRLDDFWVGLAIVIASVITASLPLFRYVNTALGAWLIASAFIVPPASLASKVNDVGVGAVVVLLSLIPDELGERVGRRFGSQEPTAP